MQIGDFNVLKGLWKFALGAVSVFIAHLIANPTALTSILPEKWISIVGAGFILELLDYLLNKIKPQE